MHDAVIGGGSWGTALAAVIAQNNNVKLWARNKEIVDGINQNHQNPHYQSQALLPSRLTAVHTLKEAVHEARHVMLVVPSHAMRAVSTAIAEELASDAMIISASKGIENDTLLTMEGVLNQTLPRAYRGAMAFISGPSFAQETLAKQATAVTVAARFHDVAEEVQQWMSTGYFRLYTTEDVTGVELGGALKNVIAIAAGVADGLGLGHNSRAALLTRGVAEISRLAIKLGANPLTLSGLSGMGDLILTCTGGLSRNRRVGYELGQGRALQDIISDMSEVAEGVKTTKSAYRLALREGVEMPIVSGVYRLLYEGCAPQELLQGLMSRSLKSERVY